MYLDTFLYITKQTNSLVLNTTKTKYILVNSLETVDTI